MNGTAAGFLSRSPNGLEKPLSLLANSHPGDGNQTAGSDLTFELGSLDFGPGMSCDVRLG
jgi:hypothetical protein